MAKQKKVLTPEEKTALSRRRIFYALIALIAVMIVLIAWAIIEIFI